MEKKEFETPEVKVIEIKPSSILCGSPCHVDECDSNGGCPMLG